MVGQVADERFWVIAPTGRDAALTRSLLLKAELECVDVSSIAELCERVEREGGAGLLIAEEALSRSALDRLRKMLARQQSWSDLPVLIFTGETALLRAPNPFGELGNVTLLDRPARAFAVLSAVRTALRARQRQYLARKELVQREEAVRRRDQFLAMLGHELRNPLAAISLAVIGLNANEGPEMRVLQRQCAHLTRLVDDLLDVSRVTTGKAALKMVTLDLVALVRTCLQTLAGPVRREKLHLNLLAPIDPIWIEADPVRIEQVVANLVTNASKYTPAGGHIEIALAIEDGEAVLSIRDDGVGLAPEMLPRVFDLFTQAESSLERSKGGMGIGLTLVRSLVEQHQGKVEAESPGLGKGCCFRVRLPLAKEPIEDRPPTSIRRAVQPKPGCDVLIIEDNADSREMLAMMLARSGHSVHEACDGRSGIEAATRLKPQALLVDIGLPGLDGYGVARCVREALGPGVLMIALSGYSQPEDKRRALEAGFNVHCTKPVDLDALNTLLSQVAS